MSSTKDQISQIQLAIAAQETVRSTLGDDIVEITLAALRNQLEILRANIHQTNSKDVQSELSNEQLISHLQNYIPKELADKIRSTGGIVNERKQVTVLFADLAGFTALSERLDPEEVANLTNEALKELAEAVYQYEGYIDKFIGDAIMAVFGAPVTHEDDPERALHAALAMCERLDGFNRRWVGKLDEPLLLHIGINTGPVIAGNVGSDLRLSYTVMGDTVNTASRLVDVALPGQILVSHETYRLTQEAFHFLIQSPIEVKGKRKPLTTFELQRARLNSGKVRGVQGLASVLVGRESELERLNFVLQRLETGHGRIVMVEGEAGIGKSRLMTEWRVNTTKNIRWLEGRSFAHSSSLAYSPLLDLFRRYAGIGEEDSESQVRERLRITVQYLYPNKPEAQAIFANMLGMRLLPDELCLLATLPAETLRQKLLSLVEKLFAKLAKECPTILILEDMHWIDHSTLDLVEHLLPLTRSLPLAIVCVRRPQPPTHLDKLIKSQYANLYSRISLSPLGAISMLELVEHLLSNNRLPELLQVMVLDKAEGNPFFVEEVIRTLIEQGALVRAEVGEGWIVTPLLESVSVPNNLQGLLMARLDSLPPDTKLVVQQAAVIGRIFLYHILAQMSNDTMSLEADLQYLVQEGIIRERTRLPELEYIFKNALTQEVAYENILTVRRKELHHKVGTTMEAIFAERLGEFNTILAEHFLQAEDWQKAARYFIHAGDAAARLNANFEAQSHYSESLAAFANLTASDENRRYQIDILFKQISLSYVTDAPAQNLVRIAQAQQLIEAIQPKDQLRRAWLCYWWGRLLVMQGNLSKGLSYYSQVQAISQELDDGELSAIAWSVLGRTLTLQGYFNKAILLLTQALKPLENAPNQQEWLVTAGYLGITLAASGKITAGLAEGERALAYALKTNSLNIIALSHLLLASICFHIGDAERQQKESQSAIQMAELVGDWLYVYIGYVHIASAQTHLGQYELALKSVEAAKVAASRLDNDLIFGEWLILIEAQILLANDKPTQSLALTLQALDLALKADAIFSQALAHRLQARILIRLDQPVEAQTQLYLALSKLQAGESLLEIARTHQIWADLHPNTETAEYHQIEATRRFGQLGSVQHNKDTVSSL